MKIAELNLSSLDGSNGFTISGIEEFDNFGFSVDSAGDINGDGIGDIIIGAINANSNGKFLAGESYVVFGSSDGFSRNLNLSSLDGSNGFRISGVEENDISGFSVSGAGDINGDAIDDLVIGAYGIERAGKSYVLFGQNTEFSSSFNLLNLNGNNGFVINGIDADDKFGVFGRSVSSAGDVNGDGIGDLIIGANAADPNGNNEAGESYVVFGRDSGFSSSFNLSSLDGSNGFVINGIDVGDGSGYSVSHAGDVNGDGIDDLIVGAINSVINGNNVVGESYLVFGRATGFDRNFNLSSLDGSNGFIINGIDAEGFFGFSVSGAGDINGDGIDDVIIGAPGASPYGEISAGSSYVVFGRTTEFDRKFNLSSLDGSNGFKINGIDAGDASGISVSNAGDANGDGIGDLIIGAYSASNGNNFAGSSYVVFGRTTGFNKNLNLSRLNGINGFVINGIGAGDRFGVSVSGAGDINDDGLDDLIIGADSADPNENENSGEAYVVFGQKSGDRIEGTTESEALRGTRFNDILLGKKGDDALRGFAGDDRLVGGAGNDFLIGGRGDDRLVGGSGFDSLRGREGEDKFIFQNVRHQADHILDFSAQEDFILISKAGFDLDFPKGRLANARFTIGSSARDRSDRFIYNEQTGALLFDPDGTRSQDAKAIAFLNPGQELGAANIRIF